MGAAETGEQAATERQGTFGRRQDMLEEVAEPAGSLSYMVSALPCCTVELEDSQRSLRSSRLRQLPHGVIVDSALLLQAPEIFLRQPYDEKVDVFSFAIVLWNLFHRSGCAI